MVLKKHQLFLYSLHPQMWVFSQLKLNFVDLSMLNKLMSWGTYKDWQASFRSRVLIVVFIVFLSTVRVSFSLSHTSRWFYTQSTAKQGCVWSTSCFYACGGSVITARHNWIWPSTSGQDQENGNKKASVQALDRWRTELHGD